MSNRKKIKLTISSQWQSYEAQVLPKNCSPVQLQETRRAFYAGAASILAHMARLSNEDISEEDGSDIIEELMQESKNFTDRIGRDR
jgi:predicted RNA-binding protein with PUA-like domain